MAGERGKTIRQLLEASGLPEEYQELILENWNGSIMKRHSEELKELLLEEKESFYWIKTKQGEIFWSQLYDWILKPNLNQLPQIPES